VKFILQQPVLQEEAIMIAWKIWHDTRNRFYGSILFVLAISVFHVALFPFLKGVLKMSEIDVSQIPEVRQMVESFASYTNIRWFEEIERNAIFGIILALGGVLAERKSKTMLLTLGLPIQRRTWILFQFGIVMLLLLTLNLLASPSLIAGGYIFNTPIPVSHILLGAFMLTLTAAPFVGMTILFTSISGDNLRACLYSFGFLILTNKLDFFNVADPWLPESFMRTLIEPKFHWQALISILAITTFALVSAIKRFEQTDY
jgi:ABC-type transport system involved in multi-copper enzyme maturation permease subunit